MVNSLEDRLSKVAALRPVRVQEYAGTSRSSGAERLVRLLDGELRSDRFGGHICVRQRFAQPVAQAMSPHAMRLIEPRYDDPACDYARWLFLDTETTGLAGGTGTYAFLVGLAWWEPGGFVVEQHFMREHAEEPSLLLSIAEHLAVRRVLVTFNGKSFDWPLLQTRFQMARIVAFPPPEAHLDLLHPSRQLWRLNLKSVALSQIERHVLGFDRGNDIPSETIPQRYFDFLRGGPPEPIAEVFRHNQMDLCGLAFLALRLNALLSDPDANGCRPGELFGISRLLQRRGCDQLAGKIYQKALVGELPKAAQQVARRELAIMAKRDRNYELSNELWKTLLDGSALGLKAYEQLAIYYEHHGNLPEKAVELSREALIKLQDAYHSGRIAASKYRQWHASFHHRLERLSRNTGK